MKQKLLTLLSIFLIGMSLSNQASAQCTANFYAYQDSTTGVFVFVNNSTGNYTNISWSFGDGTGSSLANPTHTYANNGVYGACLTIWDSTGCQSTDCDTIFVGPQAVCNAYYSYTQNANVVSFTDLSSSSSPNYNIYWNFGDGTSSSQQNPTHTYANNGAYSACLYLIDSVNGCYDQYCLNVYINNGNPTGCDASFSYADSGGYVFLYPNNYSSTANYTWNLNGTTTYNGPYWNFQTNPTGYYYVCLTVSDSLNQCTDTQCDTLLIAGSPNCTSYISYQNNGQTYYFNTYGNSFNTTAISWTFGDGTTGNGAFPIHTYANAGVYTVCAVTINGAGCIDTTCSTIYVNPPAPACDANFAAYDSLGSTFFIATTYNQNTNYSWSFGDGTSGSGYSAVHQYTNNGYYIACLTTTNAVDSCTSTNCDTIYVGSLIPSCTASFTYVIDTTTNTVTFTNTSSGIFTNSSWYFGNGSSSTQANPTQTFIDGVYIVCLTVYNNGTNCQASYCDSIVIGAGTNNCIPVFYSYPDSSFVLGSVNFGFYNSCPGTQYVWNFGDSTVGSGPNPTHQFPDSGWYDVCVTAFTPTGTYTYCDSVYSFRGFGATGINTIENPFNLTVSPNPTHGASTLKFTLINSSDLTIEILSIDGRLIQQKRDSYQAGLNNIEMNFSNIEAGIYLVRINSGVEQSIIRLIIQP